MSGTGLGSLALLLNHVDSFAKLLTPHDDNGRALAAWIISAHRTGLPHPQSFSRGPQQDQDAAIAAVTHREHDGGTEGVDNRTKDQAPDVRQSQLPPPPPPHPPRITATLRHRRT
ncbi:hypothetical protein OG946_25035 [Streptomyces sp. NBC_01808]|uniref:hypothetical protein n=1 Tax=Streptomyces sp. NBC_01808 TaxID=2975947 RepID=UPI002DDA5D30|nr:hypothetical protein [Streptomyces sp. NBC_01808]WSA40344.1 hypothetical protein OG946_25035 [Streptomyces sp. NBC_01808]